MVAESLAWFLNSGHIHFSEAYWWKRLVCLYRVRQAIEVLGSRKAAVMIYPRPKRADLELKVVQMLLSLLSQQVL